jgi:hypothetical protein
MPRRLADGGRRYAVEEVLAAIPDKGALAESLGIRFASRRPRPGGWVPGHAFD